MKLVTFEANGFKIGAILDQKVVDLNLAYAAYRASHGDEHPYQTADSLLPQEMTAFLAAGDAAHRAACFTLEQVTELLSTKGSPVTGPRGEKVVHGTDEVRLVAPIPQPPKVIMIGLNYKGHAQEYGICLSELPWTSAKFRTNVIGPGEPIIKHRLTEKLDGEVELAFVIGRRGKAIPAGEAEGYVYGYTIINDVTARDIQFAGVAGQKQFTLGKNADTFAPIGPYLVSRDEIPDPYRLNLELRLNGQPIQRANTSQVVFRIPELVSFVSRYLTLEPGDVFSTGTPERLPSHRFLEPGDVVAAHIEGLGVLENPIIGD